ncbi:MAG TPA: hypothetical protein DD458_00100 [Prolixibacteraceae bacterium]|nr:hypothetical protein [Prolixibacteraceae bacterium]HCR89945.1 hypothetical protein [Prolixibacteraceae bacterium]HCU63866.1 hypothetical protein [Prolixibacteraceae bacterium]
MEKLSPYSTYPGQEETKNNELLFYQEHFWEPDKKYGYIESIHRLKNEYRENQATLISILSQIAKSRSISPFL